MHSGQSVLDHGTSAVTYPKAKQIIAYLATFPNAKTIKIIGTFEMIGRYCSIDISGFFHLIETCIEKHGAIKICVSEYSGESIEKLPWKKIYGFMSKDGGPMCRLSATQAELLYQGLMDNDNQNVFITYG